MNFSSEGEITDRTVTSAKLRKKEMIRISAKQEHIFLSHVS